MDLQESIFGTLSAASWAGGLLWSCLGIAFYKLWILVRKNRVKTFSLKYWINDNTIDFIFGLLASLIVLRLGDYVIYLLRDKFSFQIPETDDFTIYMIVISVFIQYHLHKKRKPISKSMVKDMDEYNKTN